jgi:hypothetical protein
MKRLAHARLLYRDQLRRDCKTLFDVVEDDIFGDRMCVVFTESHDNRGPSITNSVEDAIAAFCENRRILPMQAVFFERYQAHPQDLDQIVFDVADGRPANVTWKRLSAPLARKIAECIDRG